MTNRHPEANRHQRERRVANRRIDYYPSREALAAIEAKRGTRYPLTINSGIINAIIAEWAELSGINNGPKFALLGSGCVPELIDATRANDSGKRRVRRQPAKDGQKCGARTQVGHPCRGRAIPGKRRCKWHGGSSTGPRTAEGRARALANLRQFRTTEKQSMEIKAQEGQWNTTDQRKS